MRVYGRLRTVLLALVLLAAVAPAASAVVVHNHRGHFFGVGLHRGVRAASGPGVTAASAPSRAAALSGSSSTSSLVYQGGPIVHSSAPYLIFWTPSGHAQYLQPGWASAFQQYFTDTAADSGASSNVFGVLRQYPDGSGATDYRQTFSGSQVVTDTNPLPQHDSANCTSSACVTDAQIQSEVAGVIAADHLPTDGTSTSRLPDGAPIYFVVLPSDVDVCFADGSGQCASNYFCAYHSNFTDGSQNVLYATIPTFNLTSVRNEKACQSDNHGSYVQTPNQTAADVAINSISHEFSETLTDPLGSGWWDTNGDPNTNTEYGYEVGDKCNDYSTDSTAFTPTLGGTVTAGTLYTQVIHSHQYYTQSEWSNGDSACEMQPSSGSVTAQFSAPGGTDLAGSALSFNPSGSSSTNALSGVTWNWGDGTSTFSSSLTSVSHTYATGGAYTVSLTVVDVHGKAATATQTINVYPIAAFTYSPASVIQGVATTFDGSSSAEPGGTIASYSWDFGDGSTGSGAVAGHTYSSPGTYTVKLTVTDTQNRRSTTSQRITVAPPIPPTASFTITPSAASVGQSVSFAGSGSDAQASITGYSWNFGDGHTGSGSSATNTYAIEGTYTVSLTVSAANGTSTTVTRQLTVGPIAAIAAPSTQPADGQAVTFDGSGSTDPEAGRSISTYTWDFGDGSSGTGPITSHSFANPGRYTVKLTVSNGTESNTTSVTVTVSDTPPTAAFGDSTSSPQAGQAVQFDGSASSASYPNAGLSYVWDFGDGASATGRTTSHAFSGPGAYTVRLTVTDGYGTSTTVAETVTVSAVPTRVSTRPPTAVIALQSAPAVAGQAVAFNASGSSDPNGSVVSYRWSFGDGSGAAGVAPSHAFAKGGTYSVSLTVTDGAGISTTAVRPVTVRPAARITRVAVTPTRTGATVAVTVTSAGTLTVGKRVFRLKRAGTVKFVVTLSQSQLHTLQVKHRLAVRVPLRFVPAAGPVVKSSSLITFHPPRATG